MRILLVDDDMAVRETFKDMLTDHGHEVVEAWNGDAGLHHFEQLGPFDAVLTDFQMPGMNGVQLATAIKKLDPNMPVAIASGDYGIGHLIPIRVSFLRKGAIGWADIARVLRLGA